MTLDTQCAPGQDKAVTVDECYTWLFVFFVNKSAQLGAVVMHNVMVV